MTYFIVYKLIIDIKERTQTHGDNICLFFQLLEYLIFYYYMEENPIDASEINLRNKGLKNSMGKVHKGCVKDAFTKLSIGSIPSNY